MKRLQGLLREQAAVKNPPSEEELKKMEANKRDLAKRQLELFSDLNSLFESTPIEDKEMLRISRKLRNVSGVQAWHFDYFKEYLAKIKKAEKTVLKSKGYSLDDDIEAVVKAYQEDEAKAKTEVENVDKDDFFETLVREVREKKSAMAIEGKTVEQRAEDFSRLNYLLSFRHSDVDNQNCQLPGATEAKPSGNMDMLRLKAKALSLKLKLLKRREAA